MNDATLIKEKVAQAIEILDEYGIDCWITFVRESGMMRDPMMDYLCPADMTWHSAFIIARSGETHAIVGQMEKQTVDELGVWDRVTGYVEGVKGELLGYLKALDPASIAVNYSRTSEVCDGLTHGMYLLLEEMLADIGFQDRLVSAEQITSSLKARKTATELGRMREAIGHTLGIFGMVKGFIRPGRTEREIAAFMTREAESRGLGFGWDPAHCPAVFTGPDTAGAHYQPTDRKVERGHVLNMDFGLKVEDYTSDLQRTFYILEEGETAEPPEVTKGFDTIVTSIELARRAIKPGVQGVAVDAVAREHIVSQGYEGYPHGLGHQVGRFAHDGTALLGPAWEKYANKVFEPIEENMVFTIEPRLTVPGRGVVTIEEMVVVTATGAEYLSKPQKELILIG
ncbi:MAG: Xaa-Pro peptidase family protein [Gemmatimonadetes bacterium]|nr:Xaa-Pro peptidase family protein [Gemmatimonadota bacterium]